MKALQNHWSHLAIPSRRPRFVYVVVLCTLMLLVLGLSACSESMFPTAQAATKAQASSAASATSFPIRVFFSKNPDSFTNFTAVFPVDRVSPTIGVGTFAIQLLIAGPTVSERSSGLFSELNGLFTGPSVCSTVGGPDFTLTLNKKGSVNEPGTATLKFCRAISSPGIGADARVTTEINATLKQFSTIKKVVILTKDGHCFGDQSGQDLCLR